MRRLLLILTTAIALTAILTTSASATVEVTDNQGGGPVFFEAAGQLAATPLSGGTHRCQYNVEGQIGTSGEVLFNHVDASMVAPGWDYCDPHFADCQDAGWVGQVLAPGDAEYVGVADFEVLFDDACLGSGTSERYWDFRFGVDDGNHLSWALPLQYTNGWYLETEIDFGLSVSDGLNITNIE